MYQTTRHTSAFALISVVLGLLTFSVILSLAFVQNSLGLNGSAQAVISGSQTLSLAEGCMEAALYEIRSDPEYDSREVTFSTGHCRIDIDRDGEQYRVTTQVEAGGHTRSVSVLADRTPMSLVLRSWQVR